ncbi:hypothetical protein D3C83_116690 [compost metagenome]
MREREARVARRRGLELREATAKPLHGVAIHPRAALQEVLVGGEVLGGPTRDARALLLGELGA